MTSPLIIEDPSGGFHVRLITVDADGIPGGQYSARLRTASIAREWLVNATVVADTRHGPHQHLHAVISADRGEFALYELAGTPSEIGFVLALLGYAGFDDANVTGTAWLPPAVAADLAGNYRDCVRELTAARDEGAGDDHLRLLAHRRAMLRRDIHAVALASAPLSQTGHLLLAQAMLDTDTEALPHPDDGVVAIHQHSADAADEDMSQSRPPYQQFESVAQARAWLIGKAAGLMIIEVQTGRQLTLRAAVSDETDMVIDLTGTPAQVGLHLHLHELEPDGLFLTGITQVDHLMLARQVALFEQATDFVLHTINTYGGPSTDRTFDARMQRSLQLREQIRAKVSARAEFAAPADVALAAARQRDADVRVFADHDVIGPATAVPGSGFVKADIQVGLHHLLALTQHDETPQAVLPAELIGHRIGAVTDHVHALLPALAPADAELIGSEITRLAVDPHARPAGLYPWPSLTAINARTSELTAARVRYGGREFDDALRLHHLTQAVAAHTSGPTAHPHRRNMVEALLARQRDHLLRAIDSDETLSAATGYLLRRMLFWDPLSPLPDRHVVAVPVAYPADDPFHDSMVGDLLLRFSAHDRSGQWYVGLDNNRWVARLHRPHPVEAFNLEAGVAFFDTAHQLLDALTAGIVCTDLTGDITRYPPTALPEPARAALLERQSMRDRAIPEQRGNASGSRAHPRDAPRRPPPPSPRPRRL